jgi:hypothetical protein
MTVTKHRGKHIQDMHPAEGEKISEKYDSSALFSSISLVQFTFNLFQSNTTQRTQFQSVRADKSNKNQNITMLK